MNKLANLLIAYFLLTSCSSLTPPAQTQSHQSTAALSHWSITGIMAAKNKRKSFSAMMQWQQQGPQHFTLRLFGPLNGGTVLIEKRGTHLTYQDGQRTLQSNHPEQLILTETGVKIPINHLYYWLRGIKAPQPVHAQQFNAQGQLIGFEQGGFTLKFTAYTQVDNRLLPSKIDISHPEGGVKIVIKHWDLD